MGKVKSTSVKLLTAILLMTAGQAAAQMYDKPKEPTFDYMTINISTGNPTLFWTPPSPDPQYPNPEGYIIYKHFVDILGNDFYEAIDTVDSSTFSYVDLTSNGNLERLFYRIASKGPTEPSRQTAEHGQIWLTSSYDSCNAKIDLTWMHYAGWRNIDINQNLKLYMSHNPDPSTFELIAEIDKYNSVYSITNVGENLDYYFYMTSGRIDKPFTTFSNLHHIHTKMAKHPDYMTIDSVISVANGNAVYYSIDPTTEIRRFKVIRWEQPDTNKSIFSAKVIEEFTDPAKNTTTDSTDSWAARTRKFYYKVDAYNGCNDAVKVTNLCNTIIPHVKPSGKKVLLSWDTLMVDTYRQPDRINDWVEYTVYRRAYTSSSDLNGPGELSVAAQGLTEPSFEDDLSAFQGHDPLYTITFKYYVEAIERSTYSTFCRSREIATEILPGATLPTAIDPTDPTSINGHPRNIFQPVISFDASYNLTIYDRWGGVVYHGNQGWDGRNSSGEFVKEGTYIYRLEINTSNAGKVVKNGSVSVVFPKH